MNQVSQVTLHMINDVIHMLNLEAKTGKSVTLEVGQNTFIIEDFVRKREIFVNGQRVGEIAEEIEPFI
jgi:hypothetical protein